MNNGLSRFINTISKQLFGKKQNNNSMVWASVIGLLVSAAAYFFRRNQGTQSMPQQGKQTNNSIQNIMNSLTATKSNNPIPNAVMAEFAKELLPENTNQTNKTNQANQTARGSNQVNQ